MPEMTRYWLGVLFLISSIHAGFAQVTRVQGRIQDANTRESLPFVNIIFKGTTVGTTTDANGYYEMEIQRPADSIVVSFLGYKPQRQGIKRNRQNTLNILLQPESYTLKEVAIRPGENPAHRIMRNVIENKINNNPNRIQSYQYEVYNKIQFDLNNYDEKFTKRKLFVPFNFVFNYSDTTDDGKSYLPMMLTETFTDVYYTREPERKQEYVKASRISGLKNASASQFLGDMYQTINIYENFLLIFNKSFISPVTDNFLRYYKYYLIDSVYIGNDRCYKLLFLPKRKQDLTFAGNLYIHDSTWAVRQVSVSFNDNANINYIKSFDVMQQYERVDGKYWMLKEEKSLGDFAPFEKANGMGFFGRKTTVYQNFRINQDIADTLFVKGRNIVVADSAQEYDNRYWSGLRPDSLSKQEKDIYLMVDSLVQVRRLVNIRYLTQMLITGYLHWKKFDIGQYYTFVSWNEIEGTRLKFGGITSNDFSKRLELRGTLAYGTLDQRFKFKTGIRWFVSKDKLHRNLLSLNYKSDLEQLSLSANSLQLDNVMTSLLRRVALQNVTNVREFKASYEYEWFPGLLNRFTFFNRELEPRGSFKFLQEVNGNLRNLGKITTTEFGFLTRFAWGEKYLSGEFDRVPVGSRYPVVQLDLGYATQGILGADFNYFKTKLRISDRFRFNPFGYTDVVVDAGKIWGRAPYLFLEIHQGSQTYALDPLAFNMMNIFEFASDRYLYLFLDHHFEGYFLNKIPLIRKLKWREVITLKSVIGDMRQENISMISYPGGTDPRLYRPYLESGFAIENILKIVRVDALWRMTHLERPGARSAGLRISLVVRF
jgi:hypothetical protein